MKKIDLNELYGGHWSFCGGLDGEYSGGDLEIKPLREHLEEWVKKTGWECIRENQEHIQNILDGAEDLEVDDYCTGGFGYRTGYGDLYDGAYEDEVLYECCDDVVFKPFTQIKKERAEWAREQGIKPPKTWYQLEAEKEEEYDLPF